MPYDRDMEKQQLVGLLRTLLGMAVTFGIMLLVLRFVVGIVEPGNPENRDVLRMLAVVLVPLDLLTDWLAWPVRLVVEPVSSALPSRGWFPYTAAGPLVSDINEFLLTNLPGIFTQIAPVRALLTTDYAYWMPGVLDWTLLMSIPVLSWLEHLGTRLLDGMDTSIIRRKRAETQASLARSYGLETGAAVLTGKKKKADEKPQVEEKPQAPPQAQQDPALRARLSSLAGEQSAGMPQRGLPLEQAAQTDALTGLRNRAFFDQTLNLELAKAKGAQAFLGLVLVDIDNFKHLNDTMGHAVGDAVLKKVAEVVRAQDLVPGIAFPCRYEGEAIGIVVAQTSPDALNRYAHTVCYEISTAYLPEYPSLRVTASVGVFGVKFRQDNGTHPLKAVDLIARATATLDEARRNGKNQVKLEVLE